MAPSDSFSPAHPRPQGLGFALPSLKGKRVQTNKKVHRLFNGVMATSLSRPPPSYDSDFQGVDVRGVGGHRPCNDWEGWPRTGTFCLACKHSSVASQGGGGQLPVPQHMPKGLRRLSKPGPSGGAGKPESHVPGAGPSPVPLCTWYGWGRKAH